MAEIKVEIPDLEKWKTTLHKYPGIVAPILQKAIEKSIYDLQGTTVPFTPIRTGRLRGSYRAYFSPLVGILEPTAYYGIFVHEGTSRGIVGNPFMVKGLDAAKDKVNKNFSDALNDVFKKIASQLH